MKAPENPTETLPVEPLPSGNLDESQPKDYFVFSREQHRGPFSWQEIESGMDDGLWSENDYVWTHSLQRWTPIHALPDPTPQTNPLFEGVLPEILTPIETPPQAARMKNILLSEVPAPPKKTWANRLYISVRRRSFWLRYGLTGLLIAISSGYVYRMYTDNLSARELTRLTGLLQNEIPVEQRRELLAAKTESLTRFGPSLSIAFANAEKAVPHFVVASNLPDGTRFDIHTEAIPDTLVNALELKQTATVKIKSGLARSAPFQLENGKPIPMGEYRITVTESERQPRQTEEILFRIKRRTDLPWLDSTGPIRIASTKVQFLGGKKDSSYDRQLRIFHETLKTRSTAELTEIEQFIGTLEDQLTQTTQIFQNLIQDPTIDSKTKWADFETQWLPLQRKLQASTEKWSPEWLKVNTLHKSLFATVRKTNDLILDVHRFQTAAFTQMQSRENFELQAADAASLAQSLILSLKSNVQLIRRSPDTANGMPFLLNE